MLGLTSWNKLRGSSHNSHRSKIKGLLCTPQQRGILVALSAVASISQHPEVVSYKCRRSGMDTKTSFAASNTIQEIRNQRSDPELGITDHVIEKRSWK